MKQKRFQNRILHVVPAVKQALEETNSADNVFKLATTFNVSRNSLQTIFKRENGKGIRQYKLDQRMEMAMQMLRKGKDIKEVAITLKYANTSAFSRAFKKYFGVVPTEYQNFVPNVPTLCQMVTDKFGTA